VSGGFFTPVVSLFLLIPVAATSTAAQPAAARTPTAATAPVYLTPPQPIVDILDAEPSPSAIVSPKGDTLALLERRAMPPIGELAQPHYGLAGFRVNPRTNGPHRTPGVIGLSIKTIATGAERKVTLPGTAPGGGTLLAIGYAPDGSRFAFARIADTGIELWTADVATARAARLGQARLNAAQVRLFGRNGVCDWLDDGSGLVCLTIPAGRGPEPKAPAAPTGPNIQETHGKASPVRTYEDLLTSAQDEALFEYYFTSQIAVIDAASGKATAIGAPGLIEDVAVSPNGQALLVTRTKRPFSRLSPRDDFPKDVEIWSRAGQELRAVADVPSGEGVPLTGVVTGPRNAQWNPAEPATAVWFEALDGGDLKNKVPYRDKVVALAAPFSGEPKTLIQTEWRVGGRQGGIDWTERGVTLISEFDRATRRTRTWVIEPAAAAGQTQPAAAPRKLWDRSVEDAYTNPGTPVVRPGHQAILQHGRDIYLTGTGASPEGDRPFLDRLNLDSLQAARLFHCDTTSYETVVALLSDDGTRVVTQAETRTQPPNYFVRTLPGGERTPLTAFKDPAPQLAGVQKRLIKYKRADGLDLSANLYLPPGYQEGTKLPMILWAYPQEFTSAQGAGQVKGSPNRFTTVTGPSHLLLLTQGYAILDDPRIPIVGAGETANDTYIEQLVSGAQAAVDAVVALGVTDRDHIGVGGHSYGAFMTANLLAHSDLFRAGIARSGAYNRSLTPFGFQAETRTFWEVPAIYEQMSPFWYAGKINEPILLIHGEADDNSGTFPIQSERLYMAIKGLGGTARYVTLPHEAHGYAGRESVLHVVAEMLNWADTYVKHAPPRPPATSPSQ
jgi:dipeptidyl aminopeptidase/acylaminoacyl peptidase